VPVGSGPIAVTVHPDGSRVYVVNGSSPTSVQVLDTITYATLATIPLGVVQARGIVISPDGSRLYVTTYGSGSVKVINTATNAVIATVTTGNIGLGLDISPNGSRVYVATFPFNNSGQPPWMSVIDATTNTLIGNVGGLVGQPADVGVTLDGSRGYVISQTTNVYDLATYGIVATLGFPATGSSIDFTPDGARAYVANYTNVGVVNAQTHAVIGTIPMTEPANGRAMSVAVGPGPLRTISLSGELSFGNRWVDSTSYGTLVVSNAGNSPLTVNSIAFPPGFDGAWTGGATIAGPMIVPAGGSRSVSVTFTPRATQPYGGQIVVNANQTSGPVTYAVSGTGITFPLPAADFDDDGKADIGIYRRTTGLWAIIQSGGGSKVVGWGDPGSLDVPVPADYDGDGKADVAVYRKTTGDWFIIRSSTGTLLSVGWGHPPSGDVPVPADYDGDGKADIAVYRTSTAQWFIIRSTNSTLLQVGWGSPSLGDVPVPADYDGDGKADIGVHRLSTGEWFIIRSTNSTLLQVGWGAPALGDIPVVGDYDGDGKADVAVYRLSTGGWYVIRSSNSTLLAVNWGAPALGDIPVPGDYDGDGKIDVAVYRTSTGEWFIIRSTNSTLLQVGWGSPGLGDMPPQYK
jgi:YVTN family beta-propeller protein